MINHTIRSRHVILSASGGRNKLGSVSNGRGLLEREEVACAEETHTSLAFKSKRKRKKHQGVAALNGTLKPEQEFEVELKGSQSKECECERECEHEHEFKYIRRAFTSRERDGRRRKRREEKVERRLHGKRRRMVLYFPSQSINRRFGIMALMGQRC